MNNVAQIARTEIEMLQSEGIEPTLEEIVWLNDLGRKVENPPGTVDPALAGSPIRCGNVYLWPFTIQGGEWYDKHACRLFRTEQMLRYALGFALAVGRDVLLPAHTTPPSLRRSGATLAELTDYNSARYAVNRWARQAGCNAIELEAAIVRLIPQMTDPHEVKRPVDRDIMSMQRMLAELTAGTGLGMEYWLRQTSDYAVATLQAIYNQAGAGAEDHQEYKSAMQSFICAADAIRKAHNDGC